MKKLGFLFVIVIGAMFVVFPCACSAEKSDEAAAVAAEAVVKSDEVAPAAEKSDEVASATAEAVAEVKEAKADGVSVMIDKKPAVMKSEVDAMVEYMLKPRAEMIPPDSIEEAKAEARKFAIYQLTELALLTREADKAGIKIDETNLDSLFSEKMGFEITLDEAAEKAGMDKAKFTEFIIANLRVEELLDSKVAELPPLTDDEMKVRFDEIVAQNPDAAEIPARVSASHILILIDEDTTEEQAKSQIEDIRKKALDGADFGELAKEFSECPSGERANGSLGFFGKGQMVKEFEEAAFSQEIGVVGEPVKTQFGYHIVKVDAKEPAKKVEFDTVKEEIRRGMTVERIRKVQGDYIRSVREGAQIENLEEVVVSEPVKAPVAEPESEETAKEHVIVL